MLKVKSHNTYPTTEMLVGDILDDVKRKPNVSVVVQGDIVKPIIKAMMNIDDIDIQLLDYDFYDYGGEYYIDVIWHDNIPELWVEKAWNDETSRYLGSESDFYYVASDISTKMYNYLDGLGTVFSIEE
nr:MAG TPA: hypothetical protein [Caudoviricetes sp.]